ncbi:23S rRNA (pseudouridine(1915)-N(3))-methyltransferase RlmH [Natranaerobius trueperi]|uniref:Ribosomal RNA large subunit methyltransferase H n=1 Tax=Natranaerobius trueperi TaxID=759412 RepID=A0A226BZH5_9FIRM|nr:23S rRNA (pseudouridine(1915)-N(3))-methyltransferase RlmH [Natranaerobius trueperi]OWZ83507.1 23S rRNA (pseudouridine(1915)-N(3))-methyltransferase RlmH [Natranaerobius trueperi]
MKFTIIAVGKIKEKYLIQGIKEYQKRIIPYAKLEIKEVKDTPLPSKLHTEEVNKVKREEEERIRTYISSKDYLIILDPNGNQLTSKDFAKKLDKLSLHGTSNITLVIGGTLGLSEKLKQEADLLLSFSKFTFPHQLMRLILVEQIYRALKINRNEPYHY